MVDDLGDESLPSEPAPTSVANGKLDDAIAAHRRGQLAWWEDELEAIYSGQPTHPISIAVQHTVASFDIPKEPFQLLIRANLMDQGSGRFETLDDVVEYCRHSANPVGHLYLYLFGYADRRRQLLADHTCTALQLTNFWQDVSRDYRERGRIYLPQSDMKRFGVTESDIASGSATDAFRALLRYECDIAMRMFRQGAPLVETLDRRARLPVALFTRGGAAVPPRHSSPGIRRPEPPAGIVETAESMVAGVRLVGHQAGNRLRAAQAPEAIPMTTPAADGIRAVPPRPWRRPTRSAARSPGAKPATFTSPS